jgi:hypothetical protein
VSGIAIRRDDERTKIGSLHVIHRDGWFVAAYVITMRGGEGAISTLDPDAGTWYVDDPYPATPIDVTARIATQCSQCSRFGHHADGCYNQGVVVSLLQRRARSRRRHASAQRSRSDVYA